MGDALHLAAGCSHLGMEQGVPLGCQEGSYPCPHSTTMADFLLPIGAGVCLNCSATQTQQIKNNQPMLMPEFCLSRNLPQHLPLWFLLEVTS